MNLRCLVVDDEPNFASLMEKYITKTPGLEFIRSFYDPNAAKDYILHSGHVVDVVFLDIEMPTISGINLAKELKSKCLIVFTTEHRDFAADAYRLNAIDYLLKPICYEYFLEAVNKANCVLEYAKATPDYFYIRENLNGKLVKIHISDTLYIECSGNYIKIFLVGNRFYLVHISLRKLLDALPRHNFLRIHKSFIVNLDHMQSLDGNILSLLEKCVLPIGPSYRGDLLDKIKNYIV